MLSQPKASYTCRKIISKSIHFTTIAFLLVLREVGDEVAEKEWLWPAACHNHRYKSSKLSGKSSIGAWKRNSPPFEEIMTDQQTQQLLDGIMAYREATLPITKRCNKHFVDSILGQHLLLCRNFGALNHTAILPPPQKKMCSIGEGFHFLHFH